MKVLLFIMFILFSMRGMSQISTQVSFDKKEKILTMVLKNGTDSLYLLSPTVPQDPIPLDKVSYFIFKYKNRKNEVVYTRKRLIFEDMPISESRKKQLLLDYWENEYKYHLSDWYKGEVYSVDIYIQIVATAVKKGGKTFKKVIRRSYLWE